MFKIEYYILVAILLGLQMPVIFLHEATTLSLYNAERCSWFNG